MNRLLTTCTLIGIAFASVAYADDSMTPSSMTPEQAMKDCIERQKTTGMSMSEEQMKRICKDKLKSQKATGDMPEQPATDVPHN